MKYSFYGLLAVVVLATSCSSQDATQETPAAPEAKPVMTEGHKLFINNCIQCHNIKKDKIGPALDGAMARWNNDTVRLRHFIKNSSDAIRAHDPRAEEVYAKWNQALMTPMPHLTDGDIDKLLEYIAAGED
jgi:cytochrome c551/c552